MPFSMGVMNQSKLNREDVSHIGVADTVRDVFDPMFVKTVIQNDKVVSVLKEAGGADKYELVEVILVVRGKLGVQYG